MKRLQQGATQLRLKSEVGGTGIVSQVFIGDPKGSKSHLKVSLAERPTFSYSSSIFPVI